MYMYVLASTPLHHGRNASMFCITCFCEELQKLTFALFEKKNSKLKKTEKTIPEFRGQKCTV